MARAQTVLATCLRNLDLISSHESWSSALAASSFPAISGCPHSLRKCGNAAHVFTCTMPKKLSGLPKPASSHVYHAHVFSEHPGSRNARHFILPHRLKAALPRPALAPCPETCQRLSASKHSTCDTDTPCAAQWGTLDMLGRDTSAQSEYISNCISTLGRWRPILR